MYTSHTHIVFQDYEYIKCDWKPESKFQGYYQVVHGGIQSALMDEVGGWCCQIKLKSTGVTRNLAIKYRKPLYIDQDSVCIQAKMVDFQRSIAKVNIEIINSNGIVCSSAIGEFYMFSEEISKEKFFYPEYDDFFETGS